jgi:hypothetical protein
VRAYTPTDWMRNVLPKSALVVEEEAWNAYPYTKTRYSCPFVERLTLEIETRYYNDAGTRENVFNLHGADLEERIVGEYTRAQCARAFIGRLHEHCQGRGERRALHGRGRSAKVSFDNNWTWPAYGRLGMCVRRRVHRTAHTGRRVYTHT